MLDAAGSQNSADCETATTVRVLVTKAMKTKGLMDFCSWLHLVLWADYAYHLWCPTADQPT